MPCIWTPGLHGHRTQKSIGATVAGSPHGPSGCRRERLRRTGGQDRELLLILREAVMRSERPQAGKRMASDSTLRCRPGARSAMPRRDPIPDLHRGRRTGGTIGVRASVVVRLDGSASTKCAAAISPTRWRRSFVKHRCDRHLNGRRHMARQRGPIGLAAQDGGERVADVFTVERALAR